MFNIFSTPTRTESGNLYPSWSWSTVIKDAEGKDVTVQELIEKFNKLSESVEHLRGEAEKFYEENKKLKDQLNSIEEDGTEEHNAAVKLRQENAQLKIEIDNWKVCSVKWRELYDEKADAVDELMKEILQLRHLKEENVKLIEEKAALLDKGGLTYKDAQIQIIHNDYIKCAEQRDEYKHQLNAANKEIEQLKRWKKEQLTVQSWWDKVDSYVRDHDDAPLGGFVANTCLNFLKERDELKAEVKKLKEDIIDYVIEKDDEVNELKKSQDWNKLNGAKTEKYYECNHCKYKVAHDTNYWGGCGFCKDGLMIEKEEESQKQTYFQPAQDDAYYQDAYAKEPQKHPMYPFHWGGYDKVLYIDKEIEFSAEELLKRATEYAETTAENLEEKFDKGEDVLDYFNKIEVTTSSTDKWQCPCNKCKENKEEKSWEEAASDLALKIIKLEKQIEELKITNIWQKQS